MGKRLLKAFEVAKSEGGLQFTMRLAMKSGMSQDKASSAPDAPDAIAKMEGALKEVTGKAIKL